ncbi:hypothetical protein JF535_07170 [Microbulbifer salipaludis]|uniref:Sulfotransferase domain-containing protein n=1 Tax=Microbulbifer salipaludis TaxID=187980 RepID=A0ABS3E5N8_9GAMM|nr:hypothetical protein [Microbulbifer salipaludis]MBN8430628.1 hypothetical protein [Microbulbifer salipaludis]
MTSTNFRKVEQIKAVVALWHIQHQQLLDLIEEFSDKLLPIYSEELFSRPEPTLMKMENFLSLGIPKENINAIRRSSIYQRDSKDTQKTYNPALRSERYHSIFGEHRTEIAEAKECFDQLSGEKDADQRIMRELETLQY